MKEVRCNQRIGTFRYGIIAEFVNGAKLVYGERERLLLEKSTRLYEIPYSRKQHVSRSTILAWTKSYKDGGRRIESLYPKTRSDKGLYRALDSTIRLGVLAILKETPSLTAPSLIRMLRQKKIISAEERIHPASMYRFLKQDALTSLNVKADDRRAFEASFPNEVWQCDVMHGPKIRDSGIQKKTYLCAIIDDHSRLIVYAAFFFSETFGTLRTALCEAVSRRGLPQKFYVDNGACFSAGNLAHTAAALGISLIHSRPYIPQGRGKIERWFRNVRDSFLPFCAMDLDLLCLNETLGLWVDQYNETEHGTTRMRPIDRYRANLECVRPAPANLMSYFRMVETRRVRKDRTFQLRSQIFETQVALIDKIIECRFHEDESADVEVFFNGMSFGRALPLDRAVNARIGRDWTTATAGAKARSSEAPAASGPEAGRVFGSVVQEAGNETL